LTVAEQVAAVAAVLAADASSAEVPAAAVAEVLAAAVKA
jgi:hypothetical protein